MKTRIFIMAAAIAALASSCQNKITPEQFTSSTEPAVLSTAAETKTSLGEDGKTVNWTSDDQVAVFDNLGGQFTFNASDVEGSYAKFSGNVTEGTTQILAVYPATLAKNANGNTLTVNVPANQTSKAGSFAEEHNISVAKVDKTPGTPETSPAAFKNVCALLKFTIPSYIGDATKVTLSSDSVIAGDMTVDYSAEEPVCSIVEGSKSISMNGSFAAGSTFWFVLAPVALENIAVEVETEKGTYSMSKTATIEMSAGYYKNLGTLELQKATIASATAAHTYADNTLTGTDVTVNLALDETTAKYITGVSFKLIKQVTEQNEWWDFGNITGDSKDVVLREVNFNAATASMTIPANADYPYLPAGEYFIEGSYQIGETQNNFARTSVTVGSPFSGNDAPSFVAKHNVYTSYTKYSAGKVDEANALNGAAIYIELLEANISEEILSKYGSNVKATFLLDNGSSISGEGGLATVHPTAFGAYNVVSVSSSFDGGNACTSTTEAGTYHITGIPYSYSFENSTLDNYSNDGWTINGSPKAGFGTSTFSLGGLILHGNGTGLNGTKGYVVSPKFHIPEETITVIPSISAYSYDSNFLGKSYDYTGYYGPVNNTASSNKNLSYKKTTETSSFTPSTVSSLSNFAFTSEACYMSLDCNEQVVNRVMTIFSIYSIGLKYTK